MTLCIDTSVTSNLSYAEKVKEDVERDVLQDEEWKPADHFHGLMNP